MHSAVNMSFNKSSAFGENDSIASAKEPKPSWVASTAVAYTFTRQRLGEGYVVSDRWHYQCNFALQNLNPGTLLIHRFTNTTPLNKISIKTVGQLPDIWACLLRAKKPL